jgi:sarcosine oxidase
LRRFDTIVLGLGGVGSAVCYQLARRGRRVLGLEQFSPGHAWGSSHGETRLIRLAYGDTRYLPLLRRSFELWEALEREVGRPLLFRTGLLSVGPDAGGKALLALSQCARLHGIAHEELGNSRLRERFPQFRVPEGFHALFEPQAGYVLVEASLESWCQLARRAGAALGFDEPVLSWSSHAGIVRVVSARDTYEAESLVLAGGAWSGGLMRELSLPLVVRRFVQLWFAPEAGRELARGSPCFTFELPGGFFFGAPSRAYGGIKVGGGDPSQLFTSPSGVNRQVLPEDLERMRRFVAEHLAGVSTEPVASSTCICTMTPDEHFIVDRHPAHENVCFAAGLSGHGFKFTPVLGEALADLATRGQTPLPIQFLNLRPASPAGPG